MNQQTKMTRAVRIVEIMWIAIAAVSIVEIYANWGENQGRSYMFAGFFALAVFMFFFRRRMRIRYEKRMKDNQDQE